MFYQMAKIERSVINIMQEDTFNRKKKLREIKQRKKKNFFLFIYIYICKHSNK